MERFFYLHAELDRESGRGCGGGLKTDGASQSEVDRCSSSDTTRLSIFGKDQTGGTVVIRIRGYRIHFYVSFRDAYLSQYCCTWLARNNGDGGVVALKSVSGYKGMLLDDDHQPTGADGDTDRLLANVIRVEVRTRQDVSAVVRKIDEKVCEFYKNGRSDGDYSSAVRFYESNMDPITAATRRLGLDACRWCLFASDRCVQCDIGSTMVREFVFHETGIADAANLFAADDSQDPSAQMPPFVKILSFDIECLSSDAEAMPDAAKDGIIQISSVISLDALGRDSGDGHLFQLHLFTTGGPCGDIDGVLVHECEDEASLLRQFADHVRSEDPDIITGYNITTFDLPYLLKRMEVHSVDASFGRCERSVTWYGEPSRRSNTYGGPKTHNQRFTGRILFDMYVHMRKEVVLRSYTLNNVSCHFLGKKKDDVSYREIPLLYNGDSESRARLGRYCVKDAQLVLELAFKTQTFVHAFERCKVFRTILQYTVERGQQAKFYAMLLAWCSERKILVNDVTSNTSWQIGRALKSAATDEAVGTPRKRPRPGESVAGQSETGAVKPQQTVEEDTHQSDVDCDNTDESGEEERSTAGQCGARKRGKYNTTTTAATAVGTGGKHTKRAGYEGATVLDPVPGLYHTPVVCLDYASLYPSIMIAYNLCFTTFVQDRVRGERLFKAGSAERSPVGYYFLKTSVKKGVIPSILEMLLEERSRVKRAMGALQDSSIEYRLLDGQQHALKIAANSIYGAIGCVGNILYFVEIPSSVTAYGRELITRTRDHVETAYHGTRVVYGDTDSVMVNLYDWDARSRYIWQCTELGKDMAAAVTRSIDRHPIKLQFETVYRPFLLCTKKRYAAGVYTNLERMAAMDVDSALAACRPTIKYKGLQVVRRDNCTFATRLMRFVLESLMDERGVSVERVLRGLREELKLLFEGRVNTKELVITKEWKKRCTNGQAHDRVARRMESRDPNSAPAIGDRVPYVVATTPRGAKLCDRAEDPLYVLENDLKLDLLYYADNQVAKPIAEILRIVLRHEGPLEEVKDMFWPANGPRRESDRRRKQGEVVWTRKASVGCRRLTEFLAAGPSAPIDVGDERVRSSQQVADVEDLLDALADRCMTCKNHNADAVRTCRDRECETLYERFAKLSLHRELVTRHRRRYAEENGICPRVDGRRYTVLLNS